MARILFIKTAKTENPYRLSVSPPMGVMSLAAFLRQERNGKDAFKIVDERVEWKSNDEWAKLVAEFKPDIIGISSMTIEAYRLHRLAKMLKGIAPSIPIISGGPHATAYGNKLLDDPNIDFILRGEGEISFLKFIAAFEQDRDFDSVPGLTYRKRNGEISSAPPNMELVNLSALPYPAWDLISLEPYSRTYAMAPIGFRRYAAVITSRGCPYRCVYCHNIFTKAYRFAAPNRVVDEIEHISKTYNVSEFEIYDDIFNLDYARTEAILDEIIARRLNLKLCFPNGLRGDRLDENLVKKLRRAGTHYLTLAVESASPRIQKQIRKNLKLDKVKEAIRLAANERILTGGFFMLGFPGETREEILETVNFAVSSHLHLAFFFIVIPFEGTELGDSVPNPLSYEDLMNGDYHRSKNSLAEVSARELSLLQLKAYYDFYASPKRLYRLVRDFPYSYAHILRQGQRLASYWTFRAHIDRVKERFFGKSSGVSYASEIKSD